METPWDPPGRAGEGVLDVLAQAAAPASRPWITRKKMDGWRAVEAEGTCICGGDLNVLMDYDMDTTGFKRNNKSITKLVKSISV